MNIQAAPRKKVCNALLEDYKEHYIESLPSSSNEAYCATVIFFFLVNLVVGLVLGINLGGSIFMNFLTGLFTVVGCTAISTMLIYYFALYKPMMRKFENILKVIEFGECQVVNNTKPLYKTLRVAAKVNDVGFADQFPVRITTVFEMFDMDRFYNPAYNPMTLANGENNVELTKSRDEEKILAELQKMNEEQNSRKHNKRNPSSQNTSQSIQTEIV